MHISVNCLAASSASTPTSCCHPSTMGIENHNEGSLCAAKEASPVTKIRMMVTKGSELAGNEEDGGG